MFTLSDICNIAIQIEQNGAQTYLKASRSAKDPEISKTLAWMAGEEENHVKWFESIRSSKTLSTEQLEMEAMGRSLLRDIVASNTFSLAKDKLQSSNELPGIINQSLEFEHDTIIFYEILLDFLDDDETIEKLKMIIQEEQSHIQKLKSLLDNQELALCTSSPS